MNVFPSAYIIPVRSDCFWSSCCADYHTSDRSTSSHFYVCDPVSSSPQTAPTNDKMAEEFADKVLRSSIAQLCLPLGWQNANVSALDVSSDVAKRFMLKTGSLAAKFAEIGEPLLRQTPHMRANTSSKESNFRIVVVCCPFSTLISLGRVSFHATVDVRPAVVPMFPLIDMFMYAWHTRGVLLCFSYSALRPDSSPVLPSLAGRQGGNLDDLALALQSVAVSLPSLQEYVDSVEQPGCEHKVCSVCVCVCVPIVCPNCEIMCVHKYVEK